MVCEMSHGALVHWSIPKAWQFSLGLNECLTFAVDEQAGWGWRPVKRKWPVPSPADPVIGGDGVGSFGVTDHQSIHSTSEFVETHIKRSWVAKELIKRQRCVRRLPFFAGKTKKAHQTGNFFSWALSVLIAKSK